MLYETVLYSFMFGTFCMAIASAFALMNPQIRNNCKDNENATNQTRKRNEDPVQFGSFPNISYETIILMYYAAIRYIFPRNGEPISDPTFLHISYLISQSNDGELSHSHHDETG